MRAILVLKNAIIPQELTGDFYGADQGALCCLKQGKKLELAIGDFDSVSQEEKAWIFNQAKEVIQLCPRKDRSDTCEALEIILKRGYDEVVVCGGLFGRFDHTWANIQLLLRNPSICWMDEKNRILILKEGKHEIKKEGYRYISFFSLKEGKISLRNMEYPLEDYIMKPLDSLGLSNEIIGEVGYIECSMPILCIQCHD